MTKVHSSQFPHSAGRYTSSPQLTPHHLLHVVLIKERQVAVGVCMNDVFFLFNFFNNLF